MQVDIRLDMGAEMPSYQTPGSAGVDLVANMEDAEEILPGSRIVVPTGVYLDMKNKSLMAFLTSRSGLYRKHGIRVGQGVGTIDSDYQGEVCVMLYNDSVLDYTVKPGERIAQLVFVPIVQVSFNEVLSFNQVTERGIGGFGSTGT